MDEINKRMKWRWIKLKFFKSKTISIETFKFWLSAKETFIKRRCRDPETTEG